ncbi:unnamed protein product [Calicophoron daubneyi]|uniref:Profilin n=1 Tax=Calicophoron daubneyi TaxID=300641 RepID=A0AAV2TMA6_CALDB
MNKSISAHNSEQDTANTPLRNEHTQEENGKRSKGRRNPLPVRSSNDHVDKKSVGQKSRWARLFGCTGLCAGRRRRSDDKKKEDQCPKDIIDKTPTVVRQKNDSVQGTVMFDQTSHPDVWNQIVKESILGTGLISKAVLCNRQTRAIYAYGPEGFTPSTEQLGTVMSLLMANDDDVAVTDSHFNVALESCEYRETTKEKLMLASVTTANTTQTTAPAEAPATQYELGAVLTDHSLLIGVYPVSSDIESARSLLLEVRDYLQEQSL